MHSSWSFKWSKTFIHGILVYSDGWLLRDHDFFSLPRSAYVPRLVNCIPVRSILSCLDSERFVHTVLFFRTDLPGTLSGWHYQDKAICNRDLLYYLESSLSLTDVQVCIVFFSCNAGPHLSVLLVMVSDFLLTNFEQRLPLMSAMPEEVKSVALAYTEGKTWFSSSSITILYGYCRPCMHSCRIELDDLVLNASKT